MTAILRVDDLSVRFGDGLEPVVSDVSFEIAAGECVALVGESGSGKSVTARTLVGLTGPDAHVSTERMELAGRDISALSPRGWRATRGADIGFVLQDALVSLDPLRTIGREIDDSLRLHTSLSPAARTRRVLELLTAVGMPDPEVRISQRAGELSGGMRQRALIASAIALQPRLVIADEPTTALDRSIQGRILDLLGDLRRDGTAVLLISHDLSVVSRVADRVAVMKGGRIVESGPTASVLGAPRHEYTRALLRAVPGNHPRGTRLTGTARPVRSEPRTAAVIPAPATDPLPVIDLVDVSKRFRLGRHHELAAVSDASISVEAGRTLGLVGESGSGKTTLARIALGLLTPDSGSVRLLGEPWSGIPERQRRTRRQLIGAIYQDPLSSFDPRWTVGRLLTDAITAGGRGSSTSRDSAVELLESVGLSPDLLGRHTHALSGGQRQRVAIARALAPGPRLIVCDEPVSSLDVSVQAQVLDLLDELQESLGLSYLFISHDLGVIRHISDTVAVMTAGRIVETGQTEEVFGSPTHAYTRTLLAS
jgi:peptide/nickel transport system ATP-binding protein